MYNESHIIAKCKTQDRVAQKTLYNKYAPLFFSICLRYIKNRPAAEDVMIESFYRIYSKINQYKGNGSFEGWMKRIVINECLMYLRKNNNMNMHLELEKAKDLSEPSHIISNINFNEVVNLLQQLPAGYRTIFNLYVIEGYKHREIAEQLGISINTSKSQLILAKKRLRALYKKKHNYHLNSNQI